MLIALPLAGGRQPRNICSPCLRHDDRAAKDVESARAIVDQAAATLSQEDSCPLCSIMLAVPAAVACADAGDLDDARQYLAAAGDPPRSGRAALAGGYH